MEIGDISRETSLNTAGTLLRIMVGVKCRPFLKQLIEMGTKMIFKGSGYFQFPEAVITSTAKESLCSTERGSLQVQVLVS